MPISLIQLVRKFFNLGRASSSGCKCFALTVLALQISCIEPFLPSVLTQNFWGVRNERHFVSELQSLSEDASFERTVSAPCKVVRTKKIRDDVELMLVFAQTWRREIEVFVCLFIRLVLSNLLNFKCFQLYSRLAERFAGSLRERPASTADEQEN